MNSKWWLRRGLGIVVLVCLSGPAQAQTAPDKFALWQDGTQLRGANVWQRLVVPELDGPDFMGPGPVGPPFSQADFDRLAAMGANYVNLSVPGLFTERPPYVLDEAVQANLDRLLAMVAQADLFAVITARTGPGRSDFTFYRDGAGVWFDPSLLVETVWQDAGTQAAWADMWRYTAARYRDNPVVIGYDLMCEPNADGVVLDMYDPEAFFAQYAGSLYDWNQFYPSIVAAIREVDPDTPIIVGAQGWSGARWLPYLRVVDDPRIVYAVHQYEPQDQYTHQEQPVNAYPGHYDVDWDGQADDFNREWLDHFLASTIDEFVARYRVPVVVNEYGLMRWIPGGDRFLDDEMALFEDRGLNYALWAFNTSWPDQQTNDSFDFTHGPDPDNHQTVADSAILDVLLRYWARNTIRPSNWSGGSG